MNRDPAVQNQLDRDLHLYGTAFEVFRGGGEQGSYRISPNLVVVHIKHETANEHREHHERSLREQCRALAVQLVDLKHGYTMEFSSCPAAHAAEYDRKEAEMWAGIPCNMPHPDPAVPGIRCQVDCMEEHDVHEALSHNFGRVQWTDD